MKKFFKSMFEYKPKEIIKHFLISELDDLTREIKEHYSYIRELEEKRNRVELMVFGN